MLRITKKIHYLIISLIVIATFLPEASLQLFVGSIFLLALAFFVSFDLYLLGSSLIIASALFNNYTTNAIILIIFSVILFILAKKLRYSSITNFPELVIEHSHEGLLIVNANGKITFANHKAHDLFALKIANTSFTSLLNDVDKQAFREAFASITSYTLDFTYKEKQLQGKVIPFFEWDRTCYAIVVSDITELKLAEERVQSSLNLYQTLFHEASDAIFLLKATEDLPFITVNNAYLSSTGLTLDDVVGKPVASLFPKNHTNLVENYQKALTLGEPVTFKDIMVTPNGKRVYLTTITPILSAPHEVPVFLGISKDLTNLTFSEELFRSLVQSLPLGVIAFNLDGKIIHANEPGLTLLGISSASSVDMRKNAIMQGKLLEYILETHQPYSFEKKNGHSILKITLAPLLDDNEPRGILVLLEDVTLKHVQENNLRRRNLELEMIYRIQSKETSDTQSLLELALHELFNITSADSAFACFTYGKRVFQAEIQGNFASDIYKTTSLKAYYELDSITIFHNPPNLHRIVIPLKAKSNSQGFIVLSYFAESLFPPDTHILELLASAIASEVTKTALKDELAFLSHHDLQTGLYNRTYFDQALANKKGDLAILITDLDNLKIVNDTYGHVKGDQLIKKIAAVLENGLPEYIVARIGGDEFAAIITGLNETELTTLSTKIRQTFKQEGIEASVGVAFGNDPFKVFRLADDNMYTDKAKRKGLIGNTSPDDNHRVG